MNIGVFWALLTLLNFHSAFIIHYSTHRYNISIPLQEEGSISCFCEGKKIVEDLPRNNLDTIFQGIRNHLFCTENFDLEICRLLKECKNCTAEMKKCIPIPNPQLEIQFECTTKRLEKSDSFVMKLDAKAALDLLRPKRKSQEVNTCVYPKGLLTADLVCHGHLDSVFCKQKCLYGYALKEGSTRKVSCKHSENVWKPVGFEECFPYMNCSLTLLYEGEMNCTSGTDEKFVHCNITCAQRNDISESSGGIYRCQMDGTWSSKLPFCVAIDSGIDLVPAPKSKISPIKDVMNKAINIIWRK